MKKIYVIVAAILILGCSTNKKQETITLSFIEAHSEIKPMNNDKREFKLTLLRIDRDYYYNCDNICFSTCSNLIMMGDIKGARKWQRDMLKYQRLYKKVADSINLYHNKNIIDQTL